MQSPKNKRSRFRFVRATSKFSGMSGLAQLPRQSA
jgi:hypothetical protein